MILQFLLQAIDFFFCFAGYPSFIFAMCALSNLYMVMKSQNLFLQFFVSGEIRENELHAIFFFQFTITVNVHVYYILQQLTTVKMAIPKSFMENLVELSEL